MVSLRLQGNRLTDLPLQIFRLPSLRELDVSQNLLTELSPLIGLLAPTLEELFLQSNRLQSLPQQLGQMKRLRLLDIADNHLGCIPVEVQRLVSESFASERRSMWRLNESSLSLNNTHSGNDDLQPFHIGDGPHSSTLQSPAEQHLGGHGGGGTLNITPNEDGGHDDDDYVQIRHGMKCWARGNKFWQVKASAASTSTSAPGSTPLSPITTTTTMLLAGSTQPSGAMSPPLRSPTAMDDMATGLDHRPTGSMSSTSAIQASSMTPLSISSGSSSRNDDGHPLFETHGLFDRHHSRSYARHPQRQNSHSQPHPEHLVDRRGYCKDSYTSCSWTLSLVDICSQIVGEKLHDDPHYFCHRDSCPFKKDSLRLVSGTLSPSPQQPPLSSPRKTAALGMDSNTATTQLEWITLIQDMAHSTTDSAASRIEVVGVHFWICRHPWN
ncbi:hypothetical protein BGZ99_008912 [Dissophora globulifera]|uniref:Uncharacterized protein n=1 Tax=Dissophora globulifera TaxID=979702 RepID=A0A9P6R8R1_9FUNG|nr:hypothetical protein BGZ99_008912 [Dissophora globulifera]